MGTDRPRDFLVIRQVSGRIVAYGWAGLTVAPQVGFPESRSVGVMPSRVGVATGFSYLGFRAGHRLWRTARLVLKQPGVVRDHYGQIFLRRDAP
jgi:hypothetical protein